MKKAVQDKPLIDARVCVTGVGWVTAAGFGQARRGDRFSWGTGSLPAITRKQVFADPRPHFGRLDAYSKLGVAGVAMALQDAGIERLRRESGVGLVASTVYGCLTADIDFLKSTLNGTVGSPHLFAYTLPNTFLGETAVEFGFTGPTFLLQEQEPAGRAALQVAYTMIAGCETARLVVGICDAGAPAVVAHDDARPGALFLVLSSETDNAGAYGVIERDGANIFFEKERVADLTQLALAICGCAS